VCGVVRSARDLAAVVGAVRPLRINSFEAVGTWGAVATCCGLEAAARGSLPGLWSAATRARPELDISAGEVSLTVLALLATAVSASSETVLWDRVAGAVRDGMAPVPFYAAASRVQWIDAAWCEAAWKSASGFQRAVAAKKALAVLTNAHQDALHVDVVTASGTCRPALVDKRDHGFRVPSNPTASTQLPFNQSVEVLADGVMATHKSMYATLYSTKMGINDADTRVIVLASLNKQLEKLDTAHLDPLRQNRRAVSSVTMGIIGKLKYPQQMVCTYLLKLPDAYMSHEWVAVSGYSFLPYASLRLVDDRHANIRSPPGATAEFGVLRAVDGALVSTAPHQRYSGRCDICSEWLRYRRSQDGTCSLETTAAGRVAADAARARAGAQPDQPSLAQAFALHVYDAYVYSSPRASSEQARLLSEQATTTIWNHFWTSSAYAESTPMCALDVDSFLETQYVESNRPPLAVWDRAQPGDFNFQRMGALEYMASIEHHKRSAKKLTARSRHYFKHPQMSTHVQQCVTRWRVPCISPWTAYAQMQQPALFVALWTSVRTALGCDRHVCARARCECCSKELVQRRRIWQLVACGIATDARQSALAPLEKYCLFWWTFLVPWTGRRPCELTPAEVTALALGESPSPPEACRPGQAPAIDRDHVPTDAATGASRATAVPSTAQSAELRADERRALAIATTSVFLYAVLQWHNHRCALPLPARDAPPTRLRVTFDSGNSGWVPAEPRAGDLVIWDGPAGSTGLGLIKRYTSENVTFWALDWRPLVRHRDRFDLRDSRRATHRNVAEPAAHVGVTVDPVRPHWKPTDRRLRQSTREYTRQWSRICGVLSEHRWRATLADVASIPTDESYAVESALLTLLRDIVPDDDRSVLTVARERDRNCGKLRLLASHILGGGDRSLLTIRRSALCQVERLRPPRRGRIVAVANWEGATYRDPPGQGVDPAAVHADNGEHPLPYWLGRCEQDTSVAAWCGTTNIAVRWFENPQQTPDGWRYRGRAKSKDKDYFRRASVLVSLPELGGSVDDDVHVPTEVHQLCMDMCSRHDDIEIQPLAWNNSTDEDGFYDVRCCCPDGLGGSRPSELERVQRRSNLVCDQSLQGAVMKVRIDEARMQSWPWALPCDEQPATLRLPGGALARVTLAGDTPRDTATLVTVYGRSIHATRQLRRLDNLHALIGADSKEMDNDATEQHRRAMDDQHIDDSAPHGRLYAAEADGGLVHDPVADEYDRATLNMLFAADGVAMETDKQQRYIQTAVVGLLRPKGLPGPVDGARAQAQGVADVASADTGGHRAPGAVRVSRVRDFARLLAARRAALQVQDRAFGSGGRSPTEASVSAGGAVRATRPQLPPPLTRMPSTDREFQVTDEFCQESGPRHPMTLEQTIRTGAPDVTRSTPYGRPVNAEQVVAVASILELADVLRHDPSVPSAGQTIGRQPPPRLFDGVARLYSVVGPPGVGKSVVLAAVRRHLQSHGWTHCQLRVCSSQGCAAAHVRGSTTCSLIKRNPRQESGDGAVSNQPLFGAAKRNQLRKTLGDLRMLLVDEGEMEGLTDWAWLNASLQCAKGNSELAFGGVAVVVIQDQCAYCPQYPVPDGDMMMMLLLQRTGPCMATSSGMGLGWSGRTFV
jgi:hypothetical protein